MVDEAQILFVLRKEKWTFEVALMSLAQASRHSHAGPCSADTGRAARLDSGPTRKVGPTLVPTSALSSLSSSPNTFSLVGIISKMHHLSFVEMIDDARNTIWK